jgi:hypothetical protein
LYAESSAFITGSRATVAITRVEFDPQNREALPGEQPRDPAGPAADVEGIGRTECGEIVDQRVGEGGAVAVVVLGRRAERFCSLAIEVQLRQGGHAGNDTPE